MMSETKSGVRKRVLILDPLRGLAACSVMWAHFTNAGEFLQGSAPGYAELRASGYYDGTGVTPLQQESADRRPGRTPSGRGTGGVPDVCIECNSPIDPA
jgi:hypothetical protein